MNKAFLTGFVATEPKQRIGSTGIETSEFMVSIQDIKNYNNSFLMPVMGFGNVANYINTYVKKGYFVTIDGRVVRSCYEKNGVKTYDTKVLIDNIKSLRINNGETNDIGFQKESDISISSGVPNSGRVDLNDVFNERNTEARMDDWEEELCRNN